jgi:4'-phosphopantetheinyl transferase
MPAVRPLPPAAIHVWRLALDLPDLAQAHASAALAPEEQARAARFAFEDGQRHFAAARGQLRQVLGAYLGLAAAHVPLVVDAHGKPHMATDPLPLHFNLAHSGAWALLAVARDWPVGVDLERLRPELERAAIAKRFFAPSEARRLAALSPADQQPAFFRCWARKEAYLKARGSGLALPLDQFEVSLETDDPRVLWVADDAGEAERWSLFAPALPAGYVGAVAVRARAVSLVECGLWPPGV